MTAPNTNLENQKRQHRGPLLGIGVILVVVALLFVGYLAYNTADDTPAGEGAATEIAPGGTLPAEGVPATPLADPETSPQVIETAPAPAD